ncbi:MAG: holo-ACP synthase [Ignavibacteriales bacterium]|nr:holo-ACP synthase [Ignavibacteriales bacterium]
MDTVLQLDINRTIIMVIGIGIDIIEIERIKSSIDRFGDSFLNKIYTKNELDYCLAKHNKYQHLAARFAAKEAIYTRRLQLVGKKMQPGKVWK